MYVHVNKCVMSTLTDRSACDKSASRVTFQLCMLTARALHQLCRVSVTAFSQVDYLTSTSGDASCPNCIQCAKCRTGSTALTPRLQLVYLVSPRGGHRHDSCLLSWFPTTRLLANFRLPAGLSLFGEYRTIEALSQHLVLHRMGTMLSLRRRVHANPANLRATQHSEDPRCA